MCLEKRQKFLVYKACPVIDKHEHLKKFRPKKIKACQCLNEYTYT